MSKTLLIAMVGFVALGLFVAATGIGPHPEVQAQEPDSPATLSDEDLDTVVAYIVAEIMNDPGNIAFSDEDIEEATGVTIPEGEGDRIQAAVIAKLQSTEEGQGVFDQLAGGSGASCAPGASASAGGVNCSTAANRCSDYGACSLYGDLAGATGETLEMYEAEKAEDGAEYADFRLPEFKAVALNGNEVHSSDLGGKPTVLVLLAGHCGHSIGAIGTLQKVAEEFEDQDVRVVALFLNSGSAKKVKTLVNLYDVDYEVWVHPDDSLGDAFDSHLVPTYLYVDADGSLKKKLVGQKDQKQISDLVAGFSE